MPHGSFEAVAQTGLQTLVCIGCGWLAARSKALGEPQAAVHMLNTFVMRACLPALQVWLLSIHSDMRYLENWKVLAAFMLWTLLVQLGSVVWSVLFEGAQLNRMAVHGLIMSANNSGILAPVVLEAALGPEAAHYGMLATIALYFQQLPVAELLLSAYDQQQQPQQQQADRCKRAADDWGAAQHIEVGQAAQLQQEWVVVHDASTGQQCVAVAQQQQPHKQQHQPHQQQRQQHPAVAGSHTAAGTVQVNASSTAQKGHTLLSLLAKNPLVWSTGGAAILSALGSRDLLNPASPFAIKQLAFVEGSISWLARCSVPITLFTTGMWMHGKQLASGGNAAQVLWYLLLKLILLPWLMVLVNFMLGLAGRPAAALVLLTAVPVAHTAFVISEQHGVGTEAVTSTMLVGLLLMLPHVLAVLWTIHSLQMYSLQ